MANLLTAGLAYDPYFYANAGLRVLYKRLGMAAYVQRDLAAGKGSGTGSTVQVRRAQTFTTSAMPIAVASYADVSPNYDNLVIDQWRGNGFKLTDKERTLTPEVFIRDHIAPVANAIADRIDQDLASLALEVPWIVDDDATDPYKDFPAIKKMLFDNRAPMVNPSEYAYMTDGVLQQRYESNPTFVQANTAGNDALQRAGDLGDKFGFRVFANQNATTFTTGTPALTTPVCTPIKGASSITITGTSGSGSYNRGTVLTIAGDTQKYAVKTTIAIGSTGPATPVEVVPNIQLTQGSVAVTNDSDSATSIGLAFHREAFALVMQPLEDAGPGIISATVVEPDTGLSLRSRIWGDGGTGVTVWALDALWGYKTLNGNLAVRLQI
jgi:hypothetical protein